MAYVRLIFPQGVALLALVLAVLFYGADTAAARLVFSGAIVIIAALAVALSKKHLITYGAAAAVLALAGFAILDWRLDRLDTAIPHYAALAAAGLIWMIARAGAGERENAARLWRLTLYAGGAVVVWGFFDFLIDPTTFMGQERPYGGRRLAAGFIGPNTTATWLGVMLLMAQAELIRLVKRRGAGATGQAFWIEISVAAALFLFIASALVLTASRAGIAFTALAVLVLLLWEAWSALRAGALAGRGWRAAILVAGGFAAAALLVWTLSGELVSQRYSVLDQENARAEMLRAYWDAIGLAPFLGHGLGSFNFVNDLIMTSRNAALLEHTNAAHNVYLQWLLAAGWAGSLVMWAFIAAMLAHVRKGLRERRRHKTYLRAVLCISLFVGLHGLVDFGLEIPGMMWWWAWILGLGAGIAMPRDAKRVGQRADQVRYVLRMGFAGLAMFAGLWMFSEAQMRHAANTVDRLPPERFAEILQRERLLPSAALRDAYGARALRPDSYDLDAARRASEAALEREPRLLSAWNRLVYIDLARHGRLTAEGEAALAQSFFLSPYGDREVMRWRLQVAAAAWDGLPESLRRQTASQILVQSRMDRGWLGRFRNDAPDEVCDLIASALGE